METTFVEFKGEFNLYFNYVTLRKISIYLSI